MSSLLICLASLGFLMFVAYRGFSVILFAPIAALAAVLLTEPAMVAPAYSGLFMDKMVGLLKLYFPVFMLGAVFGKLIEVSGFARSIVTAISKWFGSSYSITCIVCVGGVLTYGGVSLFVVVFALYPFAAELFRRNDIPKRLIPATIALGAFTFTMDSLPGTPQIQNIIPTAFFGTDAYAGPWLGVIGAIFVAGCGITYLEMRRRSLMSKGEGYGVGHSNEPEAPTNEALISPWLAILPLLIVGVGNKLILDLILSHYGAGNQVVVAFRPDVTAVAQDVTKMAAVWAVEGALALGILATLILGWGRIRGKFTNSTQVAVAGSLLAGVNTASEYGFGAVIAALPGFKLVADTLSNIENPLVNLAVSVNVLAGITGSSSGGLSLTLGALGDHFVALAQQHAIPAEVMHRVASIAAGGMDTLPHNGAIITLMAVTGLTHRQAYGDIFVLTIFKTMAAFVVIAAFYLTGLI
ncbi:GntP family permease [Pseudomonas sp. A014]|uniref:GntP family permease n=1 Tax=Pseudomonas sp. A014 TaxID=3458058 RepID=UPI004036FCBA